MLNQSVARQLTEKITKAKSIARAFTHYTLVLIMYYLFLSTLDID